MYKAIIAGLAIAAAGVVHLAPARAAEEYTSAKFLTRSPEQQNGYIDVAVQIAGIVASQNNTSQAQCISDWYFGGKEPREQRVKHILDRMRQNPQYHPGVIVLGVLQGVCGTFKYAGP